MINYGSPSLLDLFAMSALHGLLACPPIEKPDVLAKAAYEYAEAMMERHNALQED